MHAPPPPSTNLPLELSAWRPASPSKLKPLSPFTVQTVLCVLLLRPEGKSFKQVGSGAHSEVPAQLLLPGCEPQGLGQERGVGEPGNGVDFPRPGDLQGRPPHPSRCGHIRYGFPFQVTAGLLPVCTAGLCEVGTLKQAAGMRVWAAPTAGLSGARRCARSVSWGLAVMPACPATWQGLKQ